MTLGLAPGQADLFASTAAYCDQRVAPDSIYGILHWECFRLFPDEMFADLFDEVGRRSVPPSAATSSTGDPASLSRQVPSPGSGRRRPHPGQDSKCPKRVLCQAHYSPRKARSTPATWGVYRVVTNLRDSYRRRLSDGAPGGAEMRNARKSAEAGSDPRALCGHRPSIAAQPSCSASPTMMPSGPRT
jgi:hypothetical protein